MQRTQRFAMDCRLVAKEWLNDRYLLLKYVLPFAIPQAFPGQFAQVKIEGSPATYLRRPISICLLLNGTELWLLVQVVGEGTKTLAMAEPGALVNMLLPLGTGYSIPIRQSACLLVGGGVGMAPMLMLGKELSENGHHVHFLLGGRSKTDLVLADEFQKYGTVYYTTEDGSQGEKGYVTQHTVLNRASFDFIYSCGPKPMMQAVASFAKANLIPCEVSLENLMACGIGTCLCCVEDTVNGHVCSCTEGPVFNIDQLKW
jgi:dihydroorotate dehydrogenase electron transfer subunit